MMTTNDDDDHKSIIKKSKHLLDENVHPERGGLRGKKKKEEFHCVVVMVVESPSLGMFFFSYRWPGLSWTERDGTDACTHNMTDSMVRMGIDGCVPENFMENEQNMALALSFLLFKRYTHTPTIWWCRRRRPWVFFVSSFLIGKWDVSSRVRAWS